MFNTIINIVATIALAFYLGWIAHSNYIQSILIKERQLLQKRSIEIERWFHEEIEKLPPCKYDPSVYNKLFKSN